MNLFAELDIHDRLQWKIHEMIFAMQVVLLDNASVHGEKEILENCATKTATR